MNLILTYLLTPHLPGVNDAVILNSIPTGNELPCGQQWAIHYTAMSTSLLVTTRLLGTFLTLYTYTLVRSSVRGRKEVSWHHDWRIIRKRETVGTTLAIRLVCTSLIRKLFSSWRLLAMRLSLKTGNRYQL